MAIANLADLVTASKSTGSAKCADCGWRIKSTATQAETSAKLHAAWQPGHRTTLTVETETAYCMP